jgi:hypothetical protein
VECFIGFYFAVPKAPAALCGINRERILQTTSVSITGTTLNL